jgi:hypothetical protein
MPLLLPQNPDLKYLKHEAKRLLAAHRRGDSHALALLRHLRRFQGSADATVQAARVQLTEVQYALALAYGFSSWKKLADHVASVAGAGGPQADDVSLVDPGSLAATVDAVNDAHFHGRALSTQQKRDAAAWIASRQGLPGSYGGGFAMTARDRERGYRLFTGERIPPGPGAAHVISQEACRALRILSVGDDQVAAALSRASRAMLAPLPQSRQRPVRQAPSLMRLLPGMVCCMKCSCALYRHLACCGSEYAEFLALGVKAIRAHRDGAGGWRGWPFHYALLALLEIGGKDAADELAFAAPRCNEELGRRFSRSNVYSQRRRLLMESAVARAAGGDHLASGRGRAL